MPTVISHAVVGSALTLLKHRQVSTPKLLCVLIVLTILPDLDVIAFRIGIPYSHPLGLSNELMWIGVPLLGFVGTLSTLKLLMTKRRADAFKEKPDR